MISRTKKNIFPDKNRFRNPEQLIISKCKTEFRSAGLNRVGRLYPCCSLGWVFLYKKKAETIQAEGWNCERPSLGPGCELVRAFPVSLVTATKWPFLSN